MPNEANYYIYVYINTFFKGGIGFPRTRDCLGHHVEKHVKVGAVDGPSEAVVKQVQVYIYIVVVSAEEGRAL